MLSKLKKIHLSGLRHKRPTRPTCSIFDVYERYTNKQVKRLSRVVLVSCCFHSEHTASLALYPDTNSFYCFGCQQAGDAVTFVQKMDHVDYRNAVDTLKAYGLI